MMSARIGMVYIPYLCQPTPQASADWSRPKYVYKYGTRWQDDWIEFVIRIKDIRENICRDPWSCMERRGFRRFWNPWLRPEGASTPSNSPQASPHRPRALRSSTGEPLNGQIHTTRLSRRY